MSIKNIKIILHVGCHKTGTSSLQLFMLNNRELLSKSNLTYLKPPTEGADELPHSHLAALLSSGKKSEYEHCTKLLNACIKRLPPENTLFISSEEFNSFVLAPDGKGGSNVLRYYLTDYHNGSDLYWERRKLYIKRLSESFGEYCPEIWITLRRPDNFCMSMYQQVIRNRFYVGTISEFSASDFALFDYETQLMQWKEYFQKIRIFIYEDMLKYPGGTCEVYLNALGLKNNKLHNDLNTRKNTASHPHVIEFLRRANYFPINKKLLRKKISEWLRQNRSVLGDSIYDLLSYEDRLAFNKRFETSNARIKMDYSIITPGRDTLFPEVTPSMRKTYPGMDDEMFDTIARGIAINDRILT